MNASHDPEYVTVDVRLPAALYTDLDAYAVAHGYDSVDDAVSDAIDEQIEQT
jgi:metal-responsive CopG/Arc/MetJ family transcriptional regulator